MYDCWVPCSEKVAHLNLGFNRQAPSIDGSLQTRAKGSSLFPAARSTRRLLGVDPVFSEAQAAASSLFALRQEKRKIASCCHLLSLPLQHHGWDTPPCHRQGDHQPRWAMSSTASLPLCIPLFWASICRQIQELFSSLVVPIHLLLLISPLLTHRVCICASAGRPPGEA